MAPGSSLQAVLGLVIAIVALRMYAAVRPFEHELDDVLVECTQWSIVVTLFVGLLLHAGIIFKTINGAAPVLILAATVPLAFSIYIMRVSLHNLARGIHKDVRNLLEARSSLAREKRALSTELTVPGTLSTELTVPDARGQLPRQMTRGLAGGTGDEESAFSVIPSDSHQPRRVST